MTIEPFSTFSGDPIDLISFKQAYNLTSREKKLTNQEILIRRSESSKGGTREAAKAVFIAGGNVENIMKTLEIRFGYSKLLV